MGKNKKKKSYQRFLNNKKKVLDGVDLANDKKEKKEVCNSKITDIKKEITIHKEKKLENNILTKENKKNVKKGNERMMSRFIGRRF